MIRSHVSIWRWVRRLGPVLGSFGADPREVHRAFVDETAVNVGRTPARIWIAFEPDPRAMPDFHVSWLTAFMFMQDFAFENGAWGGLRPLEWKEEEMPRG